MKLGSLPPTKFLLDQGAIICFEISQIWGFCTHGWQCTQWGIVLHGIAYHWFTLLCQISSLVNGMVWGPCWHTNLQKVIISPSRVAHYLPLVTDFYVDSLSLTHTMQKPTKVCVFYWRVRLSHWQVQFLCRQVGTSACWPWTGGLTNVPCWSICCSDQAEVWQEREHTICGVLHAKYFSGRWRGVHCTGTPGNKVCLS